MSRKFLVDGEIFVAFQMQQLYNASILDIGVGSDQFLCLRFVLLLLELRSVLVPNRQTARNRNVFSLSKLADNAEMTYLELFEDRVVKVLSTNLLSAVELGSITGRSGRVLATLFPVLSLS